jgi:hypothetical protein
MNRLFSLALASLLLLATGCAEPAEAPIASLEEVPTTAPAEYVSYGVPLDTDETIVALTPTALVQDIATYQDAVVRVEGTVAQVCKMAGCWLTLENPTGQPIRVQVPRDSSGYVFTFPLDLGMVGVIVEGTVRADTTSVETLRHFAEDEGRSKEEIDAITEPESTVVLTARGALVKQPAAAVQP